MDALLQQVIEQMQALRADAAAAAARDAVLRAELAEREAAAAARDTVLRAELAAFREGKALSPSAPSYASVGAEALQALEDRRHISVASEPPADAPEDECAPVASPVDAERLRTCTDEHDLVAAITPLLRAARGFDDIGDAQGPPDPCARVLVNSELTPWLDALHSPLRFSLLKRPDLFATWSPFWTGYASAARGNVGKLAARALQLDGCVREFYEAKGGVGELTDADFGQLVDYHSRVKGHVRGVLFNARAFWLYESVREYPIALTKGEWTARGSRALLRRFFDALPEPPLVPLLRHLCRTLGVVPRRVTASGAVAPDGSAAKSGALLGAGGSARVFCVAAQAAGAPHAALKASTALSRADLEYEFSTLARAAGAGAPVVPVVADSLVIYVDGETGKHRGGGFLLRDVCVSAVLDSGARCTAAFASLRALHAAGFAHGDARLPNLVVRGHGAAAEFLWIDLRAAGEDAVAVAQRADARVLATSVLGVKQGGVLPPPVAAAVACVPEGGDDAYKALAAAVWSAFLLPSPRGEAE